MIPIHLHPQVAHLFLDIIDRIDELELDQVGGNDPLLLDTLCVIEESARDAMMGYHRNGKRLTCAKRRSSLVGTSPQEARQRPMPRTKTTDADRPKFPIYSETLDRDLFQLFESPGRLLKLYVNGTLERSYHETPGIYQRIHADIRRDYEVEPSDELWPGK